MEKIAERMITMCKVYEFPKQLELPKEEAELLLILGEAYAKALYNSLVQIVGNELDREKMEEVNLLVTQTFVAGMDKAIMDMEGL